MNLYPRSRAYRALVLLISYTLGLMLSLWLAYQLRFDFAVPREFTGAFITVFTLAIPIKLISLAMFRQFAGLLSYFSTPDLTRLSYAVFSGSAVISLIRWQGGITFAPPRGVILTDFVLSLFGLASIRLLLRIYRERSIEGHDRPHRRARRVGIIGAGDVGANLARELSSKKGLGLIPVAFFDDDPGKWRSRVHNIPVVGPPEELRRTTLNLELEEVIIAMPSASPKRIGEVVKVLQEARLKFETVPSLDQLATGKVRVSQLRSVDIQDLLGREPIKLQTESIRDILRDRVVMVTGAGGSIGSELCRQIGSYNPKRLLLVEQSEVQIFPIEQELLQAGYGGTIVPLVGDILDMARMRFVLGKYQPEIIFHAAAHKHVPMMESQPSEAIKNNTFGTARLGDLALEFGVDRFVLISTDKAINPTNVMGATKRLAEVYLQAVQASQNEGGRRTKYMAVRFGNVLGSSGSVVPIFQKQIAAGGPVKVTHPEVTRYFMTIPEAVGLVLQSATLGTGGEIFVLDMGKPVKIVDLARQMIELSGLRPDEDIEIEYVGLRPGEKLFEELSHQKENLTPTDHPKVMRFVSEPVPLKKVRSFFNNLDQRLHSAEANDLKLQLKELIPEYKPFIT